MSGRTVVISNRCKLDLSMGYMVVRGEETIEKLVDYMSLVRDLERDKLFVFVNMRSWFTDEEIMLFVSTALAHKYHILLIDNCEYSRLPSESRIIIDRDLCEIS